uniref:Uncharacterized protein LOC111114991 isoform X2 n=1 Tax=Crassostrea virginica TaxID=6565 RepID=A0A8B8C2E3_CRAVI|nr:uncharacterized protein LOC111114991 isoform X2 [Crassostrea virginica]
MATGSEIIYDRTDELRSGAYDVSFGELQERVVSIYTKVIELLGKDGFDKHIKSNGLFIQDVDALSLATRIDDIKKIDCPIVIAGETSSGKSSIMNFLIGNEDEVLPTNIEASTTKLCRIRNANNLTVSTRNSKEEILQTWSFKSIKNMSKKLEGVASSQDSEALFVDITLPVSIIQGNVIIVDTPGIGDEEQECMAKVMMDYLKNALAVVFVVNVANAGGIQSDRLCQITTHLRNSMNEGMCCFSPEDTIFLLNKWDTIEHDKRKDKFFESTKTKIRHIWKEINERHILKFSAIKGREQEHASQQHTEQLSEHHLYTRKFSTKGSYHCLRGKYCNTVLFIKTIVVSYSADMEGDTITTEDQESGNQIEPSRGNRSVEDYEPLNKTSASNEHLIKETNNPEKEEASSKDNKRKIYYCTHGDNRKPDQFQEFCKKFLPGHTVERMPCGTDKEQIVLVLSVPTKGRLNPYDYFSARVKDAVQTYELNKPGHTKLLLVKISSDGNNKIHQQSIMEERDCIRIAKDANIQFEYIIDIFYNPYFEFDGYKSNLDAAKRLEVFYPNPSVGFKFKQRIQNMFFPSSS